MSYGDFLDKQYGIYEKAFDTPHAQALAGQLALKPDGGAVNKSAYLVAWRFPEIVSMDIEDASLGVNAIAQAVTYSTENAHSTLSDHLLVNRETGDPNQEPDPEVLEMLSKAVKQGLNATSRRDRQGIGIVYYDGYRTNATTTVALGLPTNGLYIARNNVIQASADLKIVNSKGDMGLAGGWGTHMTVSRNIHPQEPIITQRIAEFLDNQPPIGLAIPSTLEVGHFNVDTRNGFQYTPYEAYEL
ncbi:MAG TPA: hypothetical protein VLE73_04740 [Candidatus Saccharimonadales bacterium]|nr:hypothetical protein [Candidatus Saccharimonadales bacterium]